MKLIFKTVTHVAGIEYRKDNAEKAFSLMDTDDSDNVKLVREPNNQYDHLAIKVYLEGIFIGYVPKKRMRELRKIIQREDILVKAKISTLYTKISKLPEFCTLYVEVWEL
ncbi:TPA: HIRAN domain-containing protein [Streptococcus suis]|nr:hypothetical protein [Streptococcus suis]